MLFNGSATIIPGAATPDPVTSPGDVPESALLRLPKRNPQDDTPIYALWLALRTATPGDTVTVSLYALDESTLPADGSAPTTPAQLAARRFYLLAGGAGLVLTAGGPLVLGGIAGAPPPAGVIYCRRTADTLGAVGTVLCAGV